MDSHNTGHYVNSYITKLSPTMDDVQRKLLDGVRRVHNEWSEAQTRKQAGAEAANGASALTHAATQARQEQLRRTMQMLMRFESSFRRASWKSGCEMVSPILFGHLSFTTHRCWAVFMRKWGSFHKRYWHQIHRRRLVSFARKPDICRARTRSLVRVRFW